MKKRRKERFGRRDEEEMGGLGKGENGNLVGKELALAYAIIDLAGRCLAVAIAWALDVNRAVLRV